MNLVQLKKNDEKLNSEFLEKIEKIILENRKDFDENKESILAENHEKIKINFRNS